MLILTRKSGEQITIGDDITITLLEIKGSYVKLGIEAPANVQVHRREIYEKIREENLGSSMVADADLSRAESMLGIKGSRGDKS